MRSGRQREQEGERRGPWGWDQSPACVLGLLFLNLGWRHFTPSNERFLFGSA